MGMQDLAYLRPPPQLAAIQQGTESLGFSLASEPLVGALLRTLVASKPAGRFLELGTGTGVATAWLLDGMDPASALTTVDTDPTVQQIARRHLGADPRLTFVTSGALEFLRSQPAPFDLVFADALPGKYEGLESALATVKPGGFYVIDDLLPQSNWPEGHAARVPVLIEQIAARPDFQILPIVWASGVIVAVRIRTSAD